MAETPNPQTHNVVDTDLDIDKGQFSVDDVSMVYDNVDSDSTNVISMVPDRDELTGLAKIAAALRSSPTVDSNNLSTDNRGRSIEDMTAKVTDAGNASSWTLIPEERQRLQLVDELITNGRSDALPANVKAQIHDLSRRYPDSPRAEILDTVTRNVRGRLSLDDQLRQEGITAPDVAEPTPAPVMSNEQDLRRKDDRGGRPKRAKRVIPPSPVVSSDPEAQPAEKPQPAATPLPVGLAPRAPRPGASRAPETPARMPVGLAPRVARPDAPQAPQPAATPLPVGLAPRAPRPDAPAANENGTGNGDPDNTPAQPAGEAASTPEETTAEKVQRLSAETAELVEEMKANPNLTAKELRVARRVIAKKFKAIKKLDPDHIGGNWDEKYDEHIKPNLVELNEKVNGEPGEPGRVRTAMAKARVALGNLRRKKKTEDDPDADPAVDADADPVADPDAKKSGKIRETLGNATAQVKRLGSIAVVGTYEGLKKGQKRVNEYYTHKEKGKRRIIGTVLGATALAGIGAGIYFLTNGSSDGSEFRAPGASAGVDPNAVDGHGGAKGIHPELPETPAAPVAEHVKVKSGDSVWKILNEHNGHNNHATGNAIANHQVSVTDAKGHVRTDNLGEIFKGDTVNIEMPQTSGAGQAAHEATQHAAAANTGAGQTAHAVAGPNTEVLEPFNSRTGAGTLSGATLEHVHHLGFELPKQPGALSEITQKVADFNHIKPEDLTKLPIGKQIDFPPQDQFEAWLRHFDELDKQTGKVKAS